MFTRARCIFIGGTVAAVLTAAAGACEGDAALNLTVEQIVAKNTEARGGLEAWRKVQTMVWEGTLEMGEPATPAARFVYEWKRPNKMRTEIAWSEEKTTAVFDGALGWRVSAPHAGAPTVRRYSRRELRMAFDAQGIDGLLIDHQARGIGVALDGTEPIEGRSAFRLNVTLPSGATRRVWVDAQSFLEVKSERPSIRRSHAAPVAVYYRSYHRVGGLLMPGTIEAEASGSGARRAMVIEAVTLNPSLSDAHFERPDVSRGIRTPLLWARDDGFE
jgi:hypothetical protein